MAKLEVTQVKSAIGRGQNQRNTLRSLGLKRIGDTKIVEDRPELLVGCVNDSELFHQSIPAFIGGEDCPPPPNTPERMD